MLSIKALKQGNFVALFLMVVLAIQSCGPVRLISDYDEITDKTATQVQERVTTYFVSLERTIGTEESAYDKYIETFDRIKVDLNTLEVRAAAFEKNRIVQDQVSELQSMIANLEALHQLGFTSYAQIEPLKSMFNAAFTAIIKLQMALKRGEKMD